MLINNMLIRIYNLLQPSLIHHNITFTSNSVKQNSQVHIITIISIILPQTKPTQPNQSHTQKSTKEMEIQRQKQVRPNNWKAKKLCRNLAIIHGVRRIINGEMTHSSLSSIAHHCQSPKPSTSQPKRASRAPRVSPHRPPKPKT